MAEGMNTKKMSKVHTETEWTTKEKLALASYVMRSGEQHWSGAGRFLRPLGEPGRPAGWYGPKFCAQHFTALMEQSDMPKRKRSESTENIQPSVPLEEAIVNRLTKQRIEELKKDVRNERVEYRQMKREIEMIENGELDDKLDELLEELAQIDQTDDAEAQPAEGSVSDTASPINAVPDNEAARPPTEDTNAMEVESLPPACEEKIEVDQHDPTSTSSDNNSVSIPDAPEIGITENNRNQSVDTSDTQPAVESTPSQETDVMEQSPSLETTLTAPSNVAQSVTDNDGNIFPESALLKAEELIKESDVSPPATAMLQSESDANVDQSDAKPDDGADDPLDTEPVVPKSVDMETEVTSEPRLDDKAIDTSPQTKPDTPPIEVKSVVSETVNTEIENVVRASSEEDAKACASLPSTPSNTGSFAYDSTFPYSPALSHSSDLDPESAASTKAWRKSIMILWKQVASHRYASIFLQPVTDEIAPNYSNTVYRSIDLATIKKHIESGVIRTTSEFRRDIMLMFQNALMYNNVEHDVYKWTLEMQKDFIDQIAQFIATQMMVETAQLPENKSLRRSTMRRSVLSEKSSQNTRSRRSAAVDTDSK